MSQELKAGGAAVQLIVKVKYTFNQIELVFLVNNVVFYNEHTSINLLYFVVHTSHK